MKRILISVMVLVILGILQPARAEGTAPAASNERSSGPPVEPKLVYAQWQSLYLAGTKIGYEAQSLYVFPDGGRRLQCHLFLRRDATSNQFGYFKMMTADVDARFRPRALDCRVTSGDRSWQVAGRVEDGEFVLERKVDGGSTVSRIPLEEDTTFLVWALPATLLGGAAPNETRRWFVIDESIGALLPDTCLVRVLGPRSIVLKAGGQPVMGTAVLWICGPEQVAHLMDADGRKIRSVWQTTPMVGERAGLSEARRLNDAPDGPPGVAVEGMKGQQYHHRGLGFGLWLPPYPYVTYALPEFGVVQVTDLMDEAYVLVQQVGTARPISEGPPSEADLERLADLIYREWAARFEEVRAEPARNESIGGRQARIIEGTARLGCTTFHFRNHFLAAEGLTWFVTAAMADRPLAQNPLLTGTIVQSLRLSAPEGRLPVVVRGDILQSPYYGFQFRRPSGRWRIPNHLSGPMTALELAREDQAAVVLFRVLTAKPGESLEAFVAEQARQAADNLGGSPSEPNPTTLGNRRAIEIAYTGEKMLSGHAARCTTVYTPLGSRVLALVLVIDTDADEATRKEVKQIRESVTFTPVAASD